MPRLAARCANQRPNSQQADEAMSGTAYRGLRLNLGIDDSARPPVAPDFGGQIGARNRGRRRHGLVFPILGIDHGRNEQFQCPQPADSGPRAEESKRLEGLAVFPSEPDLQTARYQPTGWRICICKWPRRNELFVCGGQAIDPIAFIERGSRTLRATQFLPPFAATLLPQGRTLLDALRAGTGSRVSYQFSEIQGWLDGSEDVLSIFNGTGACPAKVRARAVAWPCGQRPWAQATLVTYDVGGSSGKLSEGRQKEVALETASR